jgi:hypothetical protein
MRHAMPITPLFSYPVKVTIEGGLAPHGLLGSEF